MIAILFEDAVAVLGVTLAMLGLLCSSIFQTSVPDSIASIIIGILLGLMAIALGYVNGRLLIDQSVPESKEVEIRAYLESLPMVEKVVSLKTVVLGVGRMKLSAEIEFHGSAILDPLQISKDREALERGEDPTRVLTQASSRMVRMVGSVINEIEKGLASRFPSIVAMDLEVH